MLTMGAIGKDQTMQTRIQAPWSRIEPGQGGGRLMGLDGQPSPPDPRPSDSAKTPSVPAAGFSFWVRSRNCAERTEGVEPRLHRGAVTLLPLSYVRIFRRAP
jgi:hypothetical protein